MPATARRTPRRTPLRDAFVDLVDALFPPQCPGCGRRGVAVCAACSAALAPAPPSAPPPGVDAWVSPFAYGATARELVARVKYRNHRAAVPFLAAAIAREVRHASLAFDAVTWVPASRTRRDARGYDHGALLARAVARELGAPCRALLARGAGPAQTGRTLGERRSGPQVRACGRVPARVLVVDDVATTGATLRAVAHALRSGGARSVCAATAARTPPPPARVT
ncbi:MAG TPA: phosphoribosyltransferase family protein [Acidimicrobiia bacterium]|nr:phosphoribosyltransferase family protein [Acidimicrobiia bacterium]